MEDIAIIGIGLRFPGNATNPEELWNVLERGESQWSEFPKDRLNIDGYFHPGGDRQGSISFRGAHFLKDDFAAFDAPFFSITSEDAKAIDPQQRMLLEVSYEALENAGIRMEDIDGSDTSVYVGSFVKDYEQVCLRDPDWQPQYAATGNGIAIMANRISYFFNLHGPSMTLDTGCSGSLVSVHLAAQSLRNGEASLAIAAGAGMILTPNTIMPMTALNFLSPDGKCFTFDSRANGYGRGEGIGVVILKRLSDAVRDNDTIRAVIRGTRVNQDGHTTGITLPSKEAQVANIKGVYQSAGLDLDQTAYVECHGTGTQAGDWRELKAISESLGSVRSVDNPIVVGSVKPNIGHLEGAAGVAGLIKGILTLEHGKIPPNINYQNPNPDIDFQGWKVKVPQGVLDWPLPGLRRVSVNCFGFGGTNAHVILDEAPRYMCARGIKANHNSVEERPPSQDSAQEQTTPPGPQLFCFSSHERSGVAQVMRSHMPYLNARASDLDTEFLRNYAFTLNSRRSVHEWRHAIVADSIQSLTQQISVADKSSFGQASKGKQLKVCFVFCGQGAQFAQMGKDLLSFEVFRQSLLEASRYMISVLDSPFDLLSEIMKEGDRSRMQFPEVGQPVTTAMQMALVDLLASFSITPQFVVGHSSGEVAAAYACGALSRESAWQVAYFRGVAGLMSTKLHAFQGAMLATGLPLHVAEDYSQRYEGIEIACVNSPRSVTLSGNVNSLDDAARHVKEAGYFCRRLPVTVAYHSSHMRPVADEYKVMLHNIATSNEKLAATMISSVTGLQVMEGTLDAQYWVDNMVSRVNYAAAVKSMMSFPPEQRPDVIVELSPAAVLRSPISEILAEMKLSHTPSYHSVLERRDDGVKTLLKTIGHLWTRGCAVNVDNVLSCGHSDLSLKSLADLPPYPWNHTKSYWHESHLGRANRFREFPRQDLIGAPTADAIPFEPRWRGFFRVSENPWLQDHQVQKTIVYPASGMVAMALEGATQSVGDKSNLLGYEITNMKIGKAMIIPTTSHGLEMAMNFKQGPEGSQRFEFTIYSKQLDGPWEQHATGSLQVRYKDGNCIAGFNQHEAQFHSLKETCTESMVPRQLYELLDIVGMNYGSLFQNITEISKGEAACVARVRIPDTKSKMPAKFEYPHLIHPATLDAMFQTLFAIDSEPMVPTFIGRMFISADISREIGHDFTGYATANRVGIRDASANIAMTQGNWTQPSIAIEGLHFTGLAGPSHSSSGFLPNHRNLCTKIVWDEDIAFSRPNHIQDFIMLMAHKYPAMSILQVGGEASLADTILYNLAPPYHSTPRLVRYTIPKAEDEKWQATHEIMALVKGSKVEPFVEERRIDGSEPLPEYQLIILCKNQHGVDASSLRKHLKADGVLLEERKHSPHWCVSYGGETEFRVHESAAFEEDPEGKIMEPVVVIVPVDRDGRGTKATRLAASLLANHPKTCTIVFCNKVIERLDEVRGKLVIWLCEMDWFASAFRWNEQRFNAFKAAQRAAKGMLCITCSAQMNPELPETATMIGLARTLNSEDPMKTVVTLDLEQTVHNRTSKLTELVQQLVNKTFRASRAAAPRELEYCERRGHIFIPRLVPIEPLNRLIEEGDTHALPAFFHNDDRCYKLHISHPGLVEKAIVFHEVDESAPGPDDVEIILEKATITHLDLETVMGRTIESEIGMDVVGTVRRIGSNVSGLSPGDPVAALVPGGAVQNRLVVNGQLARRHTAKLPLSYAVSAFHAFRGVGRVGHGQSVLVHAGASCFGLGAVHVAAILGAEIFATVMEPDAANQRISLERCGFPPDRILDADSDSFIQRIRDLTGGRGVDVVYNSTQRHVEASFSCVRQGGIVFQFTNKATCPPTIRMSALSVSFVDFDLAHLVRNDPGYVSGLLDRTLQLLGQPGVEFTPDAEVGKFSLQDIEGAFRHVEKFPYIGFTSINGGPENNVEVNVVSPKRNDPLSGVIKSGETYVLAGGLGGLGRSICELLMKNGARRFAFLSRSGASSDTVRLFLENIRAQGADAQVFAVDIANKTALKATAKRISKQMPSVAGVFQCAAVIKDAVFDNMTYSDWKVATTPKLLGSRNLTEVFRQTHPWPPGPFFVFLASSAGVIGNRGQANYAAGNSFMDALARGIRSHNCRATSIDLGPVLGAGMLTDDDEILDILRASGFYGIRHQDFLSMVRYAVTGKMESSGKMPEQVIMGIGTGGLILQNQPADPYWSRTAMYGYLNLVDMPPPDLTAVNGTANVDLQSMLARCADTESAAGIICTGLSRMLAKAMNMLHEEIDTGKPPNVYGVDSLVAVGVRNWVLSNCGVPVSVFEVLSDKTIAELAMTIAEKGRFGMNRE